MVAGRRWLPILVGGALLTGVWLYFSHRSFPDSPNSAEDLGLGIDWKLVGQGFHQVTDIQFVPDASKTAVILLKSGTARLVVLRDDRPVSAHESPIVLQVDVRTESELGLLGLAFHPRYRENGLLYLNYTPKLGQPRTRVSEWRLHPSHLGQARAVEQRTILEVAQPYNNHNAGQLAFGPDGMLFIGLGDGGARADPKAAGQDRSMLLGSMLRLDIDRQSDGLQYTIPRDNPFVGRPGMQSEIWAFGLRNPWRFSFDPSGRLVVADVGQDEFEEVSIVERGDNLGWATREGRHCFPPGVDCPKRGFVDPVFEYPRSWGKSITGGVVYLGSQLPTLVGRYLCADFVSGRVWALELPTAGGKQARSVLLGKWPRAVSSFGRDAEGEVYVGDFASGELLRLTSGARP